ncbi:(4Fe-4S)-binding protein [Mycobacterium sp.]|uniref:(4Fe-4S)-binding protein n=1 Tax=Mycobacterium sp. TaxID=1785 RepID=UPI001280E6FE|nr:(4Fe-4S)-binding protein [Mycobacterium sp.]KAA8946924.1 MAG: hypothetical protein F6Q13_18015 [Mycobacterium sp.]
MAMNTYRGSKIEVTYDDEVCIHAGECVRGLPGVFDITKDPWINPDGASADEVAAQIGRCPSGALQYRTLD